ncbi:MAG TPA: hypothetical protein VF850_08535 [Gemmatimonadaceae bacterium]
MKGIPDGASVVIPRLVCLDPAAMIEFCADTFGAVERLRRPGPDGTVAHALVTIGPAMVMIESEWPTLTSRAPWTIATRIEETTEQETKDRWSDIQTKH